MYQIRDQHIKYGGVNFSNNVSPEEINRFIRDLPSEHKESLFNVVKLLDEAGLITVHTGGNTTVDENMQEFMIPNGGDGQ